MSQVKSIKCTNCGAPLKLLGGGRVETITCAYCKSVLDLNDHYKVLSNFKNVKALHELPFDIGMKGVLKGIEYTIIGRVDYRCIEYPDSYWSDFLLFSPLYGYAWLTYEEGNLLYSRRNRTFPNLTWSEITKKSVMVDKVTYEPYDQYGAKITYVEGELTWVAKKNDNVSFIDLIAPPFGISVEKSKSEIEYYKTEYLDAEEVYTTFNIPEEKRIISDAFHPLKPFERPFFKQLSKISLWVMLLIFFSLLLLHFDSQGKMLTSFTATNQELKEKFFTLDSTKYLTTIELQSQSTKALNNFNIKVHKENKLLFSLTKGSAYTFDYETEKVNKRLESWETRAKEGMIYLNLEHLGVYKITVLPIDRAYSSEVTVTVKEKIPQDNYLLIFAVMVLIFFFLYHFMAWRYRKKVEEERGIGG